MLKTLLENIKQGVQLREQLIELKKQLKNNREKQEQCLLYLQGNYDIWKQLLKNEEPKVRKNVVAIIGELELEELLSELFEAYLDEKTLFVRSDYVKAFKKLNVEQYVDTLKERLQSLLTTKFSMEEEKHITEEIRVLTDVIGQYEKNPKHYFIGYDNAGQAVLTTNRFHPEVTLRQLEHCQGKKIGGGVFISYEDIRDFMSVRTWQELLFPLPLAKNMELDPQEIAHKILLGGILEFLDGKHLQGGSYRFRVEIRGKLELEERKLLMKKISTALEVKSKHRLINSVSDYEVEIRLLEGKTGGYHTYLKLYTIPDHRFFYRKNTLATSIQPVTAATIMELARSYLKENAQVLDPFCGTGTMLIERNFALSAHPLYGIDLYGKAIELGRENAKTARVLINFVNRDFAQFSHEYLFDEIVTNMPFVSGKQTEEEVENAYHLLFKKGTTHLKKNGIAIVYSQNPEIANRVLKQYSKWFLLEQFPIYQRETSCLYILQYRE